MKPLIRLLFICGAICGMGALLLLAIEQPSWSELAAHSSVFVGDLKMWSKVVGIGLLAAAFLSVCAKLLGRANRSQEQKPPTPARDYNINAASRSLSE